ncbi:putative UPF0481 protein At3g02645 [Populus alba]|uniref:putative UPF0481 protein At3g02645 n=1 Tax=Populus alba TaxID=43335 RepID=UPI003CC76C18
MGTSSTTDEPSHQVSLDIEKLAKSVKDELEISNPFSDTCCIYKVPERLRAVNEKACTPRLVSIGPIHHGNEKLKAMEDHKRMYLKQFLAQSEVSVERFIELIKEKETRLRNCYAETNGFSSEYFIKMILMDAAFVIMFLLKYKYRDFRGSRDSIFYPPYKRLEVGNDICLLENQLPFFILEELCGLSPIYGNSPKPTLIELTHSFFTTAFDSWAVGDILGRVDFSEVKHLVDFLTIYHRPTEQEQYGELEVITVPSVKELHQAGVKELNEKACTPRVVSIGPIHHGNEKLKAMEDHKRMYLKEFIARTKYEYNCSNFRRRRDSIFYPPYKIEDVKIDICLLENQLPFFILEELCGLSPIFGNPPKPTLIGLTHWFFSNEWGSWAVGEYLGRVDFSEVKHLVDFLTIYHRPTEQQQFGELEVLTAPSVKELHQAGVKFVLSSSKHLLDIKFDRNKGILEIPRLQLQGRTEIMLRNMQAFEQCHGLKDGYVGDYIFLMGLFVSASKDVEMLVENRIIDNWLPSNEEVVQLFYNLNIGNFVSREDFLFEGLIKDLNAFCERPWNKWRAKYFKTPWAAISFSGAVIGLILTVIQSVCSILQVV